MKQLKYVYWMLLFVFAFPLKPQAQALVSDPVLTGTVIGEGAAENSSMSDIKSKQNAIEALQTSTVATVNLINQWQQKTYNGLLYVSNTVKNVFQIVECYNVLKDIYTNESNMVSIASQNPLSLAFVAKFQADMVSNAVTYYGQIQTLILSTGDTKLLMDAGERMQLMNKILDDLRVIDALSYSSYLKVRWVVNEGIIQSIDPFKNMTNNDSRLVKQVLHAWKF